jgi:hypothetical protein
VNEQNMNPILKTAKKILDALAFANAGNMSEFKVLLRDMEPQPAAADTRARLKLVSVNTERPVVGASVSGARQAV